MAADCLTTTITEQWIRDRLHITHPCLADVRSLSLPGTHEEKIRHLGNALNNFVRLKVLDLSYNALVSVEGVQHLKNLESLILYYNCIPSLDNLKKLCELKNLKELDLRLNPVTKRDKHYRSYLVHTMPNLRKLDDCPVRDTERKAAIMQFSSDGVPQLKNSSYIRNKHHSWHRSPTVADCRKQRHALLTDTDDVVLNLLERNYSRRSESACVQRGAEEKSIKQQRSSTPKQEKGDSLHRRLRTNYDNAESKVPHLEGAPCKESTTPLNLTEHRKVVFDPCVEDKRPVQRKEKDFPKRTIHEARGHFTPNPDPSHPISSLINIRPPSPLRPGVALSDPSNPILHPPRLTYSSFNQTEVSSSLQQHNDQKKGSYRKPLEMLLNLVDKHWRGQRSLHHNTNFLSQAVHILSMMESDISSTEAEARTLRREAGALRFQVAVRGKEHKAEVDELSAQLEETRSMVDELNEQLRTVLQENVALHKQLIKLEERYLESMIKGSPISQIKEAQTEVEELKREIVELREKVQEAERKPGP